MPDGTMPHPPKTVAEILDGIPEPLTLRWRKKILADGRAERDAANAEMRELSGKIAATAGGESKVDEARVMEIWRALRGPTLDGKPSLEDRVSAARAELAEAKRVHADTVAAALAPTRHLAGRRLADALAEVRAAAADLVEIDQALVALGRDDAFAAHANGLDHLDETARRAMLAGG
jgi:hypothetical protein